jgi:hypothetical protein
MNHRKILGTALSLAALALLFTTSTALALDDEHRRVVKKIHIKCDDGDCEHSGDEQSHWAWFSGDGPIHFGFTPHLGGGYLGVGLTELTPELRLHFGVGEDEGVMISKVADDSPALRAGLEVGDIVTGVDGESVGSVRGLARAVRQKEDGEAVLLEVWRDGSVQTVTANVEEREGGMHGMSHAFGEHRLKIHHALGLECEDGPCKVQVECNDDGDCSCTVNGEETECGELHERD